MFLTSCALFAALGGCDALPTDVADPASELALIAVDGASYAKGGKPAAGGSLTAISPAGAEIMVGESILLQAVDGAGRTAEVKWSSSRPSVVTVASDGVASGVGAGSATVTASIRNQRIDALITVTEPAGIPGIESEPTPEPEAPVTSTPLTQACSDFPSLRSVSVATASQLTEALRNAVAGDLILLADGDYTGRWTISTSGTSANPAILCGTRNAVLRDSRYDGGAVVQLRDANNWVLHGFTVRTALWGIRLDRSSNNRITSLLLHDIGQEAIGLRDNSSYNVVQNTRIYDTGRRGWDFQQWGEAVYVGSWSGVWSNGQPDRSDYNQLLDNQIGPNVTAEHIDVKEGTTGTIIRGNVFDGRGMENKGDRVDSWILVQGNDGVIENNRGTASKANGFRVWPGHDGNWGQRNVFRGNTADVQSDGYGFVIQGKDNVISCGNTVTNASSGFSNVGCS